VDSHKKVLPQNEFDAIIYFNIQKQGALFSAKQNMKNIIKFTAVILLCCIFTAGLYGCYFDLNEILNPDTVVKYDWPEVAWASSVPEYKEGRITEATVVEESEEDKGMVRIRIEMTGKSEYKKYIKALKDAGFKYYDTTGFGMEESLELNETTQTINWSGSKNNVFLTAMYIDSKSKYMENYRCDVMITIYPERPASWAE